MEKLKLFIQGFIIGVGKIMPGVSGSVMAICFGLYERIIESLSSLTNFKKNIQFMTFLGIGIILAILIGSNIIRFLLLNHYTKTMMFFIGMMIPGLFPLLKEVKNTDLTFKNTLLCVAVFAFLMLLNIADMTSPSIKTESYIHHFLSLTLCGLLDAASTIIPGISGSALLMILGYYETIITAFANLLTLTDFLASMAVLIPFLIGLLLGLVLVSKMISHLFKNHRVMTYMLIIVFAVYSILTLLGNVLNLLDNPFSLVVGIIFLVLGIISTATLEKAFKR